MRPWPLSSWWNFYPRPPRGGRRFPWSSCSFATRFLSTPSARRATYPPLPCSAISLHFYPRPPRGGRQPADLLEFVPDEFLSTPSARRATTAKEGKKNDVVYFYPRPPRGGRPIKITSLVDAQKFLSTPSARRATSSSTSSSRHSAISIHALREEGDRSTRSPRRSHGNFYPRPPRGGRPRIPCDPVPRERISIHALREEGDTPTDRTGMMVLRFLSTPSARRATLSLMSLCLLCKIFLSTPSARRATPCCWSS